MNVITAPYPALDGTQACADEDPEAFFPPTTGGPLGRLTPEEQYAVSICAHCPFQPACLRYALEHAVAGVWGGMTHKQRRILQRGRGIVPLPISTIGWIPR